ncbi:apolipoprotein N-acyltransferase [Mucilaginibacter sp. L3T2-6]|uniref:apolipoprotein N-acyltransferase n=1 Tax=Mucilaginibacter sp. L3T2-6 TaxID=3062491 RepID=UPI0026754ADA|nr:apolipoprotein N-acyltransferase [Mucilaginibacter sp. L3T2-6]MDO3640654.1 apolipoprotein N-acyltransferase [Mucilaginibacter sp. L3T2-6]MDV6213007.1 apolipoprotein N-acyltransferase [Mucilaginibacter sp. L3T2-6]
MKKNILLSILSGLMLWIAWPPTPYTTFFLFFGFVPLLLAVENIIRSDYKKKGKKIFGTAFLGFLVWNALSVYWVYNALKMVGAVAAVPVSLIPYSLAPLLMAAVVWLYYRLRLTIKRGWALAGLVCFWVGYEYLNQTWDLHFPWMTLGNGFAVTHQWVQWYEYTGVYGGTVWIWALNILLFLIYTGLREAPNKKLRTKLIIAFSVTLVLPLSFSLYRYYGYHEQKNPSNIVIAQPNIDPYEKYGAIPPLVQLDILKNLSDSLGQKNTEFFIWPETALANEINEDHIRTDAAFNKVQQFLNKYKNGNVLTGAETYKVYNRPTTKSEFYDEQSRLYFDHFNAAINIENSAEVQFYHKSKLVPGAEALPFPTTLGFLKPVFAQLGGATGMYGGQDEPGVFYSQSGIGAAPVICFDSIWGDWVADAVHEGAQFIAVITNDGWWENTSGKDQHFDYAKLRAIETRRWVCQSANTGISGFINQRGDVVQHSQWWVKTALKQDINLNSDMTFYVLHGDYIAKIGSLLAILGMVFIVVRRFWGK